MHIIAFVETVRKMRQAQKDYFRTRHPVDLVFAKKLEKLVDDTLAGDITTELHDGSPTFSDERLPKKNRHADYVGCHADRDGDCTWVECPQLRDGEPEKSGRHCPLDTMNKEL